MKFSMREKLTISVFIMIGIILVIITGVYFITKTYRETTDKLIVENHEGQALLEYKMSLGKLLVAVKAREANLQANSEFRLDNLIDEVQQMHNKCNDVISEIHNRELLTDLERIINILQVANHRLNKANSTDYEAIIHTMAAEIEVGFKIINALIAEVQHEIAEYEKRSQTAILHGSSTIVLFGTLLILILTVAGTLFVQNLTNPIKELLIATRKIRDGEHGSRVFVKSEDEFTELAESFNKMLDVLQGTTVSKDYLDNIINNMFNSLLVTDKDGIIITVNAPTSFLLGYETTELIGKHILTLFHHPISNHDAEHKEPYDVHLLQQTINNQHYFHSKSGHQIAVAVRCTLLTFNGENADGLIIVGHDLTEMKAYEKKIEQNRKESLIAINEAQEEERMRIATDLHDGLGQMLTAISYSLQGLCEPGQMRSGEMQQIHGQLKSAIQETKNLAHNLIPIVLKDFGLIVAIQNLIDKVNAVNNTRFRFSHYDFTNRLDSKLEKAIYRICQESLNNILKHANAKNATFQLFKSDEFVTFVIEDDGEGFDLKTIEDNQKRSGIGLMSIRERVESFNGTFTINTQKQRGTELIIEIPF
jgi:PAS domain S-box-containing protein